LNRGPHAEIRLGRGLTVQVAASLCRAVAAHVHADVALLELHMPEVERIDSETAVARRGWGVEASRLLVAYAIDTLGLHRIEAKVYRYNTPSVNALTRNSFQQEGVLRDACLHDGKRCDILVFSILEDEVQHQRQREQYPYMGFWERAA